MHSEGFRTFGGKKYEMLTVFSKMAEARQFATGWRLKGHQVRITRERNGMYYIWSRKNDLLTRTERR